MDINSYRSRVDTQPVQINRTDSIPSDSIRITRFFIDFDEDGQPYEAFATQQKEYSSKYDKGDYAKEPNRHRKIYNAGVVQNKIQQSVIDFTPSNADPVWVLNNRLQLFQKMVKDFYNQTNQQELYKFLIKLINDTLNSKSFSEDEKFAIASIIQKTLKDDRPTFNRAVALYMLKHIDDWNILEYIQKQNQLRKQGKSVAELMQFYATGSIVDIANELSKRAHMVNENKIIGDKYKMNQKQKPRKNPLIQRTIRNLQTQDQLSHHIIKQCDGVGNMQGITATKKQVIQIRDQNGNMIRVIDKATNPELYNQICGSNAEQLASFKNQEPVKMTPPDMNYNNYDESTEDTQQFDNGQCETCEDEYDVKFRDPFGDGLRNHPFAGFGVSQIPVITPPTFNGKMFQNLQKTVQDIDNLLIQNTQTIDGKIIKKKKIHKH